MAGSLTQLWDHVVAEMTNRGLNVNNIYAREAVAWPVSKQTLYNWVHRKTEVSEVLLACVPALAQVLYNPKTAEEAKLREYELYVRSGVVPGGLDAALVAQTAAREMGRHVRNAQRALQDTHLSGTAEALVVDRLLRASRDYEVRVWPVVRGHQHKMLLRTWVGLRPIDESRQRMGGHNLQLLAEPEQRNVIRDEVITDALWRSLGLRWRPERPLEWPYKNDKHRIEIPIGERNRDPGDGQWQLSQERPQRILVLSGLWGHGETLARFLGAALEWGVKDARYQGFRVGYADEEKFRQKELMSTTPHFVWALTDSSTRLLKLAPEVRAAARGHLLVLTTYGNAVAMMGAHAFKRDVDSVQRSQAAAVQLATEVNRFETVLHVHHADQDVVPAGKRKVDVDLFFDHVLYSAAEVLNLLQDWHGPAIGQWRRLDWFERLRRGTEYEAAIPPRDSHVQWCDLGQLPSRLEEAQVPLPM